MNTATIPVKYTHEAGTHNLESPGIIVPYLMEKFQPRSVVDVGCGIGTFLAVFRQQGVQDVLGIDGKWVDRRQLMIPQEHFLEADLEKPIRPDRSFDLVLCLEVAEHLAPASADTIVDSLTGLGKRIVFSAATRQQGGQYHINEQEFSYWKKKFESKGYRVIDCLRPYFWNMSRVQWWYKQNMFLVLHESIDPGPYKISAGFSENHVLIHPDLYYERMQEYEKQAEALRRFGAGEGGNVNLYLKLLFRSFTKSFRK
ncbi:MAG TPA: class I SAM-dependent methyltransferase [Puia sp.]|nr:class I SAM-dependent methyltransferase [Puia sp.]